ncbi:MAG TPA: phosphomethylpyrimidine synthase ThiC, partial [Bacteroidetes bacterium]|nr:phosphomethylpyrimidine synthase ThiC [Bacteroidota bacterium]
MKTQQLPIENLISTKPFPRSEKIYVKGKLHDINVAMRKIETDDVKTVVNGVTKKEKVSINVYDTSGPFTDTKKNIDVRKGIEPLRSKWIAERN